jgi:hypothetical protein
MTMNNYAVLISGVVSRSLFVTAENEEEAKIAATHEWCSTTGGEVETAQVLLLERTQNDIKGIKDN